MDIVKLEIGFHKDCWKSQMQTKIFWDLRALYYSGNLFKGKNLGTTFAGLRHFPNKKMQNFIQDLMCM